MFRHKDITVKESASGQDRRARRAAWLALMEVLLLFFSVLFVFPFVWMVSVSLQTEAEMMTSTGFLDQVIPNAPRFLNYVEVFKVVPFLRYFRNSAIVTTLTVLGSVTASSLAAYSFSRLRYPGRKAFVSIMLATMIMPQFVLIVPMYKMYSALHFIDTWLPLVLPAFLGGGAGNIYLIVQFFQTVPQDLSESAKIDGAGHFRIWAQIMLPLCKPVIASVAIFAFLFSWNDFMTPLIYVNNPRLQTVALGLKAFQSQSTIQWGYLMAGSLISMIPIIVVFIFCQRYFVEGIKMSGIKA